METHARFARFAWLTLGWNFLVILWGTVVRATGSGAGCGSHWPLCDGEVVPVAPSVEKLIEFSHRATSGLALILVVALFVWARRAFERAHPARRAALASLILIVVEALIGAGLVLLELVADNASMARAFYMAAHLVNTFLLIAALALTAHWAGGGEVPRFSKRRAWPFALAFAGTLLIGISGAIAALGDTLFPASSHAEAWRQNLSATSHVLLQLRIFHPLIAVAVSLYLLHLAAGVVRSRPNARGIFWGRTLLALVLVELLAGLVNWLLLAPVWMQVVHLLFADLLWLSLVLMTASALAAPEEAPAVTTAARATA